MGTFEEKLNRILELFKPKCKNCEFYKESNKTPNCGHCTMFYGNVSANQEACKWFILAKIPDE